MINLKGIYTIKYFYLLFASIAMCSNIVATPYSFTGISTTEGLSHKTVNCVLQDSHGFIWIGTSDGLNRFDGYSFKKYYKNAKDSLSLNNNNVIAMTEDFDGNLWLCTGSGFYCYAPIYESFTKIVLKNGENSRLAEDVCVDNTGGVWGVENSNTIINLNSAKNFVGKEIKLDSILGCKDPLFNKRITYSDGYLWVFSSQGIVRFDPSKMAAVLLKVPINFLSPRSIRKGKAGELFIVDWNQKIYVVNTQTLEIELYREQEVLKNTDYSVGITDVLKDTDGSLWILKFPGLFKVSASGELGEFNIASGYDKDYDKLVYFNAMQDRDGNLWLGTQDEGVIVVSKDNNIFKHISINSEGFKDLQATSFVIDASDVFLCTHSGIFYKNNQNNSSQALFTRISKSVAYAVAKYSEHEFVLFQKNKVFIFNTNTNQKKNLFETSNLQNGIIDSRGIIWVTHWEHGLEGYNPETNKHYHIDVDKEDKSQNVVFTLVEDNDGSLWLGTFGAGLQQVKNPDSNYPTITKYVFNNRENSLSNNFITFIFDDGKNSLWLGTNGGGLNHFDKKRKTFEHFTTDDGLRSNVVQAIVSDFDGNIWFSSNVISKFDTKEKTFTHYDVSDGVLSRYFTCHAQSSPNGTLYFGDDKGILTFNPKYIDNNKTAPVPQLSAIRLFGKEINPREKHKDIVPFNKSITFSDTIELPHNLNSLSLEFASVLQPDSKNISYSFMMEGIDEQWIYAKYSERQAIYVSLPHGKYTFVVRASSGNNIWSKTRTLHIIISPPWWKTVWFRLVTIFLLVFVIAIFIYLYTDNLKQRNIKLEKLVLHRTGELQTTNTILREERMVVEMKNKYLNDVLQSKEKLINIIAHDFKGPLNGIVGFAQLLQKEKLKKKYDRIDEFIEIISNSAKSLVNQMIDLLNWAQTEDENLQANPIEINTKILVEDAISLVRTVADQKNISLELFNNCSFNTVVDPRMGSMVFRNILSNAIKFTHNGGSVTILIQEASDGVDISFVDNGNGMKKETLDSLLSTGEKIESTLGTNNEIGTGFGLRMSNIFLEKNKGKLSITSAERQGTVVTVSLPKGTKNVLEDTNLNVAEQDIQAKEQVGSRTKNIVLVVDDDREIINIIKKTLETCSDVIEAHNGKEGINIAIQVLPDVIISDIQMPETTGIELCEYLKQNKKTAHIPLLMVSSFNDEETKNKAFSAGANDYIEKPFNAFQLLKKVEALLVLKQKISEKTRIDIAMEAYPDMPDDYDDELIQKVHAYVESHINIEKLNVNTIAQELNISRTHLWRLYKNRTGQSLSNYINERKLQKAYAMLLTQKYRIADIAYDLGYADPRYFSKWFAKECGMTPTQYVEKMNNSK